MPGTSRNVKGSPTPLGATVTDSGVGFSVYSETAEKIWLCLFDEADAETDRVELLRGDDNLWHVHIDGLGAAARYGLRADGRYDPAQGYYFDPNKLLVDPYAKRIDRAFVRSPKLRASREESVDTAPLVPKAIVRAGAGVPSEVHDTSRPHLIYEVNVRAHTMRHPNVQGPLRGTVAGLTTRHVLDHILHIGADVVELMPVTAWLDDAHLPKLGLTNVWGYNPIAFMAPEPRITPRGPRELKAVTEMYREAGVRVVLDVVFNHTGEGAADGPVLSMRGLDARTYYRYVEENGQLRLVNDAGTGNTLRCDHPAVQDLILASLRYWVTEIGISGFRFDLATILGRTMEGFSPDAVMIERIRNDDILKDCLLIAEPWDPGPGGYHVGRFGEPFLEWNDRYRDKIRRFWKGDDHTLSGLATRLAGSADQFNHDGRKPSASVNFLAAHDGFTLADVVAYAHKHNGANGEDNRDGHDANHSWNYGIEGPTEDPAVLKARDRDIRAMLATLFVSHGTPMLTAGDEFGRTQRGNNNAYAQDNETTWLDWEGADQGLIDFTAEMSRFRRDHPALRTDAFLTGEFSNGFKDVTWLHPEGREMTDGDWMHPGSSVVGMFLHEAGEVMLVWFNRLYHSVDAVLPEEKGLAFKTSLVSCPDADVSVEGNRITLPARSVVVLAGSSNAL
ncbi:glycogen debranching protein GlgX [Pelagibacterium limicola]|uniref:glycogen debranching protein GlgX n=1 Tax=Pelagibacterium limicola TaxID=2791022 RepID=UPI0018AF7B42|nr:glycogen debranching protein GlgX [Pelagibacterium limicola]